MGIKKSDTYDEILDFVVASLNKLKTTGKGSRTRLGNKLIDLGERVIEKFPAQPQA